MSAKARQFSVVVAALLPEYGIGANGTIPWRLKPDLEYFKSLTSATKNADKKNAVIMGRKTWQSIPKKFRPLPNRLNIVLTRDPSSELATSIELLDDCAVCSSFEHALECLSWSPYLDTVESVYVIGGQQIYNICLSQTYAKQLNCIYLTKIWNNGKKEIECDTFLQFEPTSFEEVVISDELELKSLKYQMVQLLFKDSNSNSTNETKTKTKTKTKTETENANATENAEEKQVAEQSDNTGSTNANTIVNTNTNAEKENVNTQNVEASAVATPARTTTEATATEAAANNDNDSNTNKSKTSSIPAVVKSGAGSVVAPEHEEYQYLKLIRHILDTGVDRADRTGTGTKSVFGAQMRYSLRDDIFPLLTTKRVFWRGVAEELLWFMNGCTSAIELQKKRVHIWDGNSTREFLDGRGLTENEEGDLGPVYGFQWRHFGAEYKNMHTDYTGCGVDQLQNCIDLIRNNPCSRRIVMSAWNPSDLDKMALPPCHMFCQFYVANGELSCQMYQRSADMGLGVPFNIASYALLTRIIAQICKLKPGEFVHTIGDAHVYLTHVKPLIRQLKRKPNKFPRLKINPNKKNIADFVYDDFKVIGYKPQKSIKMKMAV